MKIKYLYALFALFALTLYAQTNDPGFSGFVSQDADPLPSDLGNYWTLAISGITPILIWGLGRLVPKIPVLLLPTITPLVGIGLGLLINAIGNQNLTWMDMGKAGALAVFIRETINQLVTKRLAGEPIKLADQTVVGGKE